MQKLLEFIVAKRHWILFILCGIISFTLIYRNSVYQRNMIWTSANAVSGSISSVSSSVFSYLDLQNVNQVLHERNNFLEMELLRLREQVDKMAMDTISFSQISLRDTVKIDSLYDGDYVYKFIPVGVVNNSTSYLNNYITINKGKKDGLRPDMGVVSPLGVVGFVATVNDNYSVVISLLHVKLRVSCKIKDANYYGPLSWKGGNVDYAYLEELPTHATFQIGDTVVTSGYTDAFPPGIMVGVVESYDKQHDDNFYSLKVRLATDFRALSVLSVIDNLTQKERKEVEAEAKIND